MTGNGLEAALVVMFLAAVAVLLATAALRYGIRLGDAAYGATRRRVKRRRHRVRAWLRFRSLRWDARRELHTGFFEPWVEEERRRRRERS